MLSPFVAGAVLAYIVAPLVDWLEHRRVGRRTLGTLLVIVLLMLALACLLVLIVPMLIARARLLVAAPAWPGGLGGKTPCRPGCATPGA